MVHKPDDNLTSVEVGEGASQRVRFTGMSGGWIEGTLSPPELSAGEDESIGNLGRRALDNNAKAACFVADGPARR